MGMAYAEMSGWAPMPEPSYPMVRAARICPRCITLNRLAPWPIGSRDPTQIVTRSDGALWCLPCDRFFSPGLWPHAADLPR